MDYGVASLLKLYKYSIALIALSSISIAKGPSDSEIINKYLSLHRAQYKETCNMQVYNKSKKLYKDFLGDGIFIPFKLDGQLDEESISEHIPLMKKKREWVANIRKRLSKMRSFRNVLARNREIRKQFESAMEHNYNYRYAKTLDEKSSLAIKSKKEIKQFLKDFNAYLGSLYFYQSFKFPVDHLHLRSEYDKYKNIETPDGKAKSNSAYLLRKIVEDGSVDSKRGRSDLSLRSLIDSVYLRSIGFEKAFLTDDLRYDIHDLIDRLDRVLRRGHKKTLSRIKYWEKKIIERENYYG